MDVGFLWFVNAIDPSNHKYETVNMNFSTRISSDCTNKYCFVVVVVVFAFVDAAVIVFVIIILS